MTPGRAPGTPQGRSVGLNLGDRLSGEGGGSGRYLFPRPPTPAPGPRVGGPWRLWARPCLLLTGRLWGGRQEGGTKWVQSKPQGRRALP